MLAVGLCSAVPVLANSVDLATAATATDKRDADGCEREIRWRNRTSTALQLAVDGLAPRVIAAGQQARWCAPGTIVGYTVQGSDWQYRGQAVVTDGERHQIDLTAPGSSIRVFNATAEPQSIALDGDAMGAVAPGESKIFGPVAVGDRHLTASSLRSAWVWGKHLKLVAGARVDVALPSPSGVVRLLNPLDEDAQVAVDGKPFGAVGRAARVSAIGLGPGAHQVRWVGMATGAVSRQVVAADDALDTKSPTVQARVSNRTGEELLLPQGLRDIGVSLPAHATATWQLPRGDYGVVAVGADSGLPYKLEVLTRGPAQLSWTIRRPTALVRVVNASGDLVKVDVPALGPLPVPAGKSALLRVPAGRLSLVARQDDREQTSKVSMFLRGGEEATWRVAAQETAVVVANGWSEPAQLLVDGRLVGPVASRNDFRVPVSPGEHTVQLLVPRIGWREQTRVRVRDGDRLLVRFEPPGAALHLDNRGGPSELELFIDGVAVVAAKPGAQARATVPAGRVAVRVAGTGGTVERQERVAPTQQLQVLAPPHPKVKVTVINSMDHELQVGWDGAALRVLAAGEAWSGTELELGDRLLSVVDQGRSARAMVAVVGQRAALTVELRAPSQPADK